MKINDDLITKELPKEKIAEFKSQVRNTMHLKNVTGFRKFILSKKVTFCLLSLIVLSIVIIALNFLLKKTFSNLYIFNAIYLPTALPTTIIIVTIGLLVMLPWYRKKVLKKVTNHINMVDIFKEWFKLFKIDPKNVTVSNADKYMHLVESLKMPPQEAILQHVSPAYSFIYEKQKTTFITVTWRWKESFFHLWRGEKLRQTYMINENLAKKWDNFNFTLCKKNSFFAPLFNVKLAQNNLLENEQFNKTFSYVNDDELKMRMLFTPYTQESLLSKTKFKEIFLTKRDEKLITTFQNKDIDPNFSPFLFDLVHESKNSKHSAKEGLIEASAFNFVFLMKIIGHARLLKSLFK